MLDMCYEYEFIIVARFVVWAKPNLGHKCETQLGIPITVTPIDIPLILVKDKSNTREASWVTLGGLQWEKGRCLRVPVWVKFKDEKEAQKRVL